MDCRITVTVGSIVKQGDCDAIVNSSNQNARAGSGVCGAIYAAAGPELEPCSISFAPLKIGHAFVTPGFLLPNPWIIHVRGPKYLFDPDPAGNLARSMESVLRLASEHQMRKIAVPAISMGIYAYPPVEAVPILINTTAKMLPGMQSIREVRFVVIHNELAQIFHETLANQAKE